MLVQSPAPAHFLFASHLGHDGPPQSVSVSLPLKIESLQVAPAHFPSLQESVVQSAPAEHRWVSLQAGHAPPQSMSVSVPFFKWSLQTAGWHTKSLQTSDRQSELPVHA